MQPTKLIRKGDATGNKQVPYHPLHIAMFGSGLGTNEELEVHLDAILGACEARKDLFAGLVQDCRIVVHCSYSVHDQGGWTISAELCKRMASTALDFVFNVEHL